MYYDVKCHCGDSTNKKTRRSYIEAPTVFTAQTASFLLTDDLLILTNTSASLLQIFKLNGIEDTSVLEQTTLLVGLKEIMQLLKGSLLSKTPITDIILMNISSAAAVEYEPDALPRSTKSSENDSPDSNNYFSTVKALVQKSTKRILLAEARQDFIDFLFSLLTIPLGRIFSLNPQISPVSNGRFENGKIKSLLAYTPADVSTCIPMKMIDPKGHDSFVKGPATFMVTDDLVVATASSTFIISTLNQMKIPVSDVEEHELHIGMEEALSILKASLFSTSALTNGLGPFLKIQPKQEMFRLLNVSIFRQILGTYQNFLAH
ncbi:uncharacterized protein [Henckelia pumila]|uniref:uncharacterized protein n=1 Tax=Henckelia pumila TaxID=405737 RepID=UPI003C6E6865